MSHIISLPNRLPTESEVEDVLMSAFDHAYYGDPSDDDHRPYEPDDTIALAAIACRALCDAGYLLLYEEN